MDHDTILEDPVRSLAALACTFNESSLEAPWVWGSYNEGVRFAFFRIMEELRSLAVRLAQARSTAGRPPSQAQRILAQYHAAYRDYEAAITGLGETALTQPPAEGEWPVQKAMTHILGADMGFYVMIRYALERHHSGDDHPARFDDTVYDDYLDMTEANYTELMDRPASGLLAYHAGLHRRILTEFSLIGEDDIDLPANYWEKAPLPLRFRLGRFESHLRQHTIQIDKTLAALGHLPNESLRLVRMVYAALAEAEGARLGAPDIGTGLVAETAALLAGWVHEIAA